MQRTLKFASIFACAVAATAFAQDENRRPRLESNAQPAAQGQEGAQEGQEGRLGRRIGRGLVQVQDRDFVALLQICNRAEVDMSTFVQDKLQNEKAKEFAAMMIKDHSATLDKLANFARPGEGAVGNTQTETPKPGIAVRTPGGVDVQVGGNRSFYVPGVNPLIQVKEEIAQECLTSAKKEFEGKTGPEVDKCFIGMAIAKHAEMVSTLTVYQKRAQDSQFKELLGQSLTRTQHHLEMAKNIMKTLEGKGAQ